MLKNLPAHAGDTGCMGLIPEEYPLEKEMSTHSTIRVSEIPWTEKPGWLQSMELQRVGHDLATKPPLVVQKFGGFRKAVGL